MDGTSPLFEEARDKIGVIPHLVEFSPTFFAELLDALHEVLDFCALDRCQDISGLQEVCGLGERDLLRCIEAFGDQFIELCLAGVLFCHQLLEAVFDALHLSFVLHDVFASVLEDDAQPRFLVLGEIELFGDSFHQPTVSVHPLGHCACAET